jgi:hypothetical protein
MPSDVQRSLIAWEIPPLGVPYSLLLQVALTLSPA